jgi:hypothetical protein
LSLCSITRSSSSVCLDDCVLLDRCSKSWDGRECFKVKNNVEATKSFVSGLVFSVSRSTVVPVIYGVGLLNVFDCTAQPLTRHCPPFSLVAVGLVQQTPWNLWKWSTLSNNDDSRIFWIYLFLYFKNIFKN